MSRCFLWSLKTAGQLAPYNNLRNYVATEAVKQSTHNQRFIDLMDFYLPHYQQLRKQLNRLPVRHEDWGY